MKRIILTTTIMFCSMIVAIAQDSVFDAFVKKAANSLLTVSYEYQTMLSGVNTIGEGTFSIQKTSYTHIGSGLEIWCDGESIWTADPAAKEMVIESVMQTNSPFATNPTLVLVSPSSSFDVEAETKIGEIIEYRLVPKVSCGVKDCVISFSGNIANPIIREAVLTLEDKTKFVMKFKNVSFSSELKDESYFRPREFGPSWVVTDLR